MKYFEENLGHVTPAAKGLLDFKTNDLVLLLFDYTETVSCRQSLRMT